MNISLHPKSLSSSWERDFDYQERETGYKMPPVASIKKETGG
jgi:hypothetical protein